MLEVVGGTLEIGAVVACAYRALQDFECAGRLTSSSDVAQLEGLHFANSHATYTVNACFKRGEKWYVAEVHKDACVP